MPLTRREMCVLLPTLLATVAATGQTADSPENSKQALPSEIYDLQKLPVYKKPRHNYMPVFQGKTSDGMPIELHESALAPGGVVHEMYSHPGDELFLVREGILEVEFNGKCSEVGPGSVAYVASNTEYAIRNTSKQWTRYFVFLLGTSHPPIHKNPTHS